MTGREDKPARGAGPTPDKDDSPSPKEARVRREADALRDNLRRRKEQTRGRKAVGKDDAEPS